MLIDFIRQLLVVDLKQFDGLFHRLKHLVGGRLSVLHPVQYADHVDQSVVVALA